ncbi:MAG: hypothetical protein Q4C54_00160 [Clostridia bacterium]|nr:hypothetical protein [Clostridia bacterium]
MRKITKRIACLFLALMLCLASVCASAAEYTLLEKMGKQLQIGSGLKGSITIFAGADAENELLKAVSGIEIGFTSIASGAGFVTEMHLVSGEENLGTTTLWSDGATVALSSELAPEVLLTLPTDGDIWNALFGQTGNSPVWYSVAANIMNVSQTKWEMDWAPVLQPYYTDLELWLNDFAAAPVVSKDDNGETVILIRYEIPEESIKEKLVWLVRTALNDEKLVSLLKSQMTGEQIAAYLDAGYLYFYEALIDAISLPGKVIFERELTGKGEECHTRVTLPLADGGEQAWRTLSVDTGRDSTEIVLSGDSAVMTIELAAGEKDGKLVRSGTVTNVPQNAENEAWSFSFSVEMDEKYEVDSDTRQHTWYNIHLTVANTNLLDGKNLNVKEITPADITCKVHLHSKSANTSPTTLETEGSAIIGLDQFTWQGKAKTAAPWAVSFGDASGGTDVRTMDAEAREHVREQLSEGAIRLAATIEAAAPEQDTADEAADAAPTEAPAETEAPDEAQEEEPAEEQEAPAGDDAQPDDTQTDDAEEV